MKRFITVIVAFFMLGVWQNQARAQFAVIDSAHITANELNHLQEMVEWYSQIENMLTQIGQLEEQLTAMTGLRDAGSWNRDDTYQGIPTNWLETLDMMERGDELGERSRDVRDEARFVPEEEMDHLYESTVEAHERRAAHAASHQSANAELYDRAAERLDNLNDLLDRVDTTADVKESSDLIARMVGEQTLLTNELVMLMARAEVLRGQQMLEEVTTAEMDMVTRTEPGSWPTFTNPFTGDTP